ncbi:MAG TPA: hypothetical protein ACQGQG_06840 [Xylella sp.]
MLINSMCVVITWPASRSMVVARGWRFSSTWLINRSVRPAFIALLTLAAAHGFGTDWFEHLDAV